MKILAYTKLLEQKLLEQKKSHLNKVFYLKETTHKLN